VATFGRRPLIDHDNLEEYADPVDYDRHDSSDTGVAFLLVARAGDRRQLYLWRLVCRGNGTGAV
jgi:hypothetical protein